MVLGGLDLAQPMVWLYLLAALGLANLWWKRRESRRRLLLLTVPFVLLSVLCSPLAAYLALGSLEWSYPPLQERPEDVEAIVVLSGYVRVLDEEGTQVELGIDTLYRCLRAAEVYHQGKPCPVVVSGGRTDPAAPGPPLAVAMREFLLKLGVRSCDLLVEDRSRNTYENAVETCRLLDERGLHRIVLVTDAAHLKRAAGCFRKLGAEVVPCGCRYRAARMEWSIGAFLPDPGAAQGSKEACHEWLGATWYSLRGRL
jgi:uncharacterized SAM-binding protein YcdF (DUF218 family)